MKGPTTGEVCSRRGLSHSPASTYPSVMEQALLQLEPRPGDGTPARADLVRRARLLAWFGIGWHVVEAGIAIAAGLVAGSIALIGFGADSVVESAAGLILIWRFAG